MEIKKSSEFGVSFKDVKKGDVFELVEGTGVYMKLDIQGDPLLAVGLHENMAGCTVCFEAQRLVTIHHKVKLFI